MAAVKRVMVRYKVKPGREKLNEALVRAVYAELEKAQPAGFRYATFKQADGLSFVHFASVKTEDGRSPLPELGAFAEFQAAIRERCDEVPIVTELEEIGSFRMFGR